MGRVEKKLDGPKAKKKKLDNELKTLDVKKSYLSNSKDKLTAEQQAVINAVNANYNIFFTGKYSIIIKINNYLNT